MNFPYGFEIRSTGAVFKEEYEIYDLAREKKVFDASVLGSFKPSYILYDLDGCEIMKAAKTSFWSNKWKIMKKGFEVGKLYYTGGCNNNIQLVAGHNQLLGTRFKWHSYQFTDDTGFMIFMVRDTSRIFSNEFLVEVYGEFEPEYALLTGVMVAALKRQSQAAAVAAST